MKRNKKLILKNSSIASILVFSVVTFGSSISLDHQDSVTQPSLQKNVVIETAGDEIWPITDDEIWPSSKS